MNRAISLALLSFLLMIIIGGCDITQLVTEDKQTKEEVSGEEGKNNSNTVFENEGQSSKGSEIEEDFKNLVKTNLESKYEIKNMEGYYSIGPLEGHLINIKWESSNSVFFRTDNSEKARIS
ncbi:MAG: hypothetical protein K0R09_2490, partial [Clostridiales bacterium]|nr:hypothetical protein [Clostridiales bacterium]